MGYPIVFAELLMPHGEKLTSDVYLLCYYSYARLYQAITDYVLDENSVSMS